MRVDGKTRVKAPRISEHNGRRYTEAYATWMHTLTNRATAPLHVAGYPQPALVRVRTIFLCTDLTVALEKQFRGYRQVEKVGTTTTALLTQRPPPSPHSMQPCVQLPAPPCGRVRVPSSHVGACVCTLCVCTLCARSLCTLSVHVLCVHALRMCACVWYAG